MQRLNVLKDFGALFFYQEKFGASYSSVFTTLITILPAMRIIEWNCQGAFRKKNKEILALKPDILIVPECEQEDKLQFGQLTPKPHSFFWHGDTGKKGVGVFSYAKFEFTLLKEFNPEFRYVIPLEVSDGSNSFILFAVWAMDNKQNPLARYITQVWLAINYYESILQESSIIIGDFNSNKIWDEKERLGNHTDVVDLLNAFDIESLYHKQYNEDHGNENLKTFFMQRNVAKPYHIDYVFASKSIIKSGYNLTIEPPKKWIDKSDHVPLILEIAPFESKVSLNNTHIDFAQRRLGRLNPLTKAKFKDELSAIEILAGKLDADDSEIDYKMTLIQRIEALKQIDGLMERFKTNHTNVAK